MSSYLKAAKGWRVPKAGARWGAHEKFAKRLGSAPALWRFGIRKSGGDPKL